MLPQSCSLFFPPYVGRPPEKEDGLGQADVAAIWALVEQNLLLRAAICYGSKHMQGEEAPTASQPSSVSPFPSLAPPAVSQGHKCDLCGLVSGQAAARKEVSS